MSLIGIHTKEETKMYNYDVEAFLKEGQEVYGLRGTIEKAVDEDFVQMDVSKVVLTGSWRNNF